MRDRKIQKESRPYDEFRGGPTPKPRSKKPRGPRVHLTHFEIRRGTALRLRIAVADDALAEVGDELGALIKRIAPGTQHTQTTVVAPEPAAINNFFVTPQHAEHGTTYHAELCEHLTDLFGTLCDTGLEAALDIARQERDRRAEGGN